MKKHLSIFACLALLVFALAPSIVVYPQRVSDVPLAATTEPQDIQSLASSPLPAIVNFVLQDPPVVVEQETAHPELNRGGRMQFASIDAQAYEASLQTRQKVFEAEVAQAFPDANVITELRKLLNVVAIQAPGWELARIAKMPDVGEARVAKTYHAVLDKSVPLINAPALWNKLGGGDVAGQGVKIAILDTGIDITNPLFSGAGFSYPPGFPKGDPSFVNRKVIAAKAFLAGGQGNPQDQNGHGTNVAGIAAGDLNTPTPLGPISGVAPAAYLGNYRVLDGSGQGTDSQIAAGLESALSDGFDIASMSLGGGASAQLDLLATAVENAVAAGMVVVVAAGNDGPTAGTIATPGIAPHAITVAASSDTHAIGPSVSVSGPGSVPANLQGIVSTAGFACPEPFTSAIGPSNLFAEASLPKKNKRGCKGAKIPAGSLAGDVALIERGNCTFTQKIDNAQAAGAVAAIIYNQDLSENPSDGGDNLVLMDVTGSSIPSVFVRRTDGLALASWISANPGSQVQINQVTEFTEPGDIVAGFSSRGPTPAGVLKPDVAAPGVNIYSGAIKGCGEVSDPTGFTAVSGTSQATPHVAGAAALLKQMNPGWTPEQIKSALISSATHNVFDSATDTVQSDVLEIGGGRIDLDAASSVAATTDPANLSFGVFNPKKIKNVSENLTIHSVDGGQPNYTVSIEQLNPDSNVTVSSTSPAPSLATAGTSSLTVSISVTKAAAKRDYTGYVIITPSSGPVLKVPYWFRL